MQELTRIILENTISGKIDLEVGSELLRLLKAKPETGGPQAELAITGMALKMPRANNPAEYWDNLSRGVDCIGPYPNRRRADSDSIRTFLEWDYISPEYCEGGYLDEIDAFDYEFFKLVPKEAQLMDPCQRLFLQIAWHALEDAGYGGQKLYGSRTGVYVGYNGWPVYGQIALKASPAEASLSMAGNLASIIPSRISHLLDLRGPAVLVDTACSSSLVAVHLARIGILNGDCDLAIAGGVNLRLLPFKGIGAIGIESAGYRTKTFDQYSDGTVWGEGVAAVVLKPLAKARRDGDHIYAVLKGSTVNQDGNSIGITAPNVLAQEDMLVKAWRDAGVEPETISYIEAHGTGTPLGDPVEVAALSKAFRRFTTRKQFCAISAVKTNIGHLDSVSGIAGLIKAVLALQHQAIPPLLHFQTPNRKIDFTGGPVYVTDRLIPWPQTDSPRRCGVNSFGLSGTNCHVVLEEAPPPPELPLQAPSIPIHILALSAKSEAGLRELIEAYRDRLAQGTPVDPEALCYTANTGRGHYSYRVAFLFGGIEELAAGLRNLDFDAIKNAAGPGPIHSYYGHFKIVPEAKEGREAFEITNSQLAKLNRAARLELEHYLETAGASSANSIEILRRICLWYAKGAEIDWQKLYPAGRTISLPVYPFARKRCWLDIPAHSTAKGSKMTPETTWYYQPVWRQDPAPEKGPAPGASLAGKSILIINPAPDSGRYFSLAQCLAERGARVITAFYGVEYGKIAPDNFRITGAQKDYETLIQEIDSMALRQIIFLAPPAAAAEIQSWDALSKSLRHGVESFYNLIQALAAQKVATELDLVLIAENVNEVTGTETGLHPEHNPLFGLGKTVRMEHFNLICRALDLDPQTAMEALLAELAAPVKQYLVAYRDGRRYVEEIARLDIESCPSREIPWREDGVYLITGGAGGVGLVISKFMARSAKVNLAWLNRTPLPEKREWPELIAQNRDFRLVRALQTITEIEASGSTVACYGVDIGDETGLDATLREARSKYGRINGIVHSAGVPGDGSSLMATMRPKVQGAWLLHQLTLPDRLDFFALFSTGMTVTGGAGVGDYVAANAYLDAFAAYRRRLKPEQHTFTINWPTWKESVMKAAGERLAEERQLFKFITNDEAVNVFKHLLAADISRAITGKLNYESSILYLEDYLPFTFSPELKRELNEKQGRLRGTGAAIANAPRREVRLKGKENFTEMERRIAGLWGEVLGFTEINVYDNFYELGGDSIQAVQVIANLPDLKVEVTDLFRYPTIEELSLYLEGQKTGTVSAITGASGNLKMAFTDLPGIPESMELENITPFTDVLYKDCFYNAFFPVVHHFQREITPFLADDLLVYQYLPAKKGVKLDVAYLSIKGTDGILAELGIQVETRLASENLARELVRAISGGRPVILRIDCFYAPNRFDTYQETHWDHCLLVYGYDQRAGSFKIMEHDDINSLAYKPQTISYQDLEQAYGGYLANFQKGAPIPTFYEFRPREEGASPKGPPADFKEVFRGNLRAKKAQLVGGLSSLPSFQADLREMVLDQRELARNLEELIFITNRVLKAKYALRYQLTRLLEAPPELMGILKEIIDGWDYLKVAFEKFKYSKIYRDKEFQTAIGKLDGIYQREQEFYGEVVKEGNFTIHIK
ncbi:MAG: KR domain-containing protein [Firmicutes bacterium]|nr:KR domain-containing protein [Bacillota bacterium]